MRRLSDEIVQFFQSQGFTVITTIDKDGSPHNSCKGIVEINKNGKIHLLDLYMQKTYENLRRNPRISITAVDEHKFRGYCLKGKAKLVPREALTPGIIAAWESKLTSRITQRLIRNMHGEKGHSLHPEALFPKPAYMIVMEVKGVIDLTPHHLKQEA
ncbi:MAG: pyridoxamine 5'-phosphate oxidase family protein [Candidatus Omnitrophica bacterium]|nr:pyridoxamine 5'-phosphate oxidase family protein [Candidatus Omnitrophota bacterium]